MFIFFLLTILTAISNLILARDQFGKNNKNWWILIILATAILVLATCDRCSSDKIVDQLNSNVDSVKATTDSTSQDVSTVIDTTTIIAQLQREIKNMQIITAKMTDSLRSITTRMNGVVNSSYEELTELQIKTKILTDSLRSALFLQNKTNKISQRLLSLNLKAIADRKLDDSISLLNYERRFNFTFDEIEILFDSLHYKTNTDEIATVYFANKVSSKLEKVLLLTSREYDNLFLLQYPAVYKKWDCFRQNIVELSRILTGYTFQPLDMKNHFALLIPMNSSFRGYMNTFKLFLSDIKRYKKVNSSIYPDYKFRDTINSCEIIFR